MVKLLLKKSYQHKDLKEIKFHDLWNSYGVFTTMRVIGRPAKILFFKSHINNLFKSLKVYKINKKNIKKNILKLIKLNFKIFGDITEFLQQCGFLVNHQKFYFLIII